jgi:DNA-binding response OmpR family regulator
MDTKARILVVDDEAGVRFFLEEILTRDGHQVMAVDSGEAALECIKTQDFDLALIDLKMRGIGGMEVLIRLRRRSPETAVIVLTAHASLDTAVQALREGAHDYLFKPCKTVELRESVRTGLLKHQLELRQHELLSQLEHSLARSLEEIRATGVGEPVGARSASAEPGRMQHPHAEPATETADEHARFLEHGRLIVDFMRHVITLDGCLLELSPTEFDLLAYLASEAPRVISPQELVREVQGYENEAWEARDMVRYHVYRIRRKMKAAAGDAAVIRTVRGVGYTVGE